MRTRIALAATVVVVTLITGITVLSTSPARAREATPVVSHDVALRTLVPSSHAAAPAADTGLLAALLLVTPHAAPPATAPTTAPAPAPPPPTTTSTAAPPAVATPAPAPAPVVTDATSTATADWACIRDRESNDRYGDPSAPSGAYGIIQSTWHSYGYSGWPYQAPPATQDALALRLYNSYGWAPWSSRYACGL